jgi:hypothetical protein
MAKSKNDVALAFLILADIQGNCTHCGVLQPSNVVDLIRQYGKGTMLSNVPQQPCGYCDEVAVELNLID